MDNIEEVDSEDDKASLLPSNQSSHESRQDTRSTQNEDHTSHNNEEERVGVEVEDAGVPQAASNQLISKESPEKSDNNNSSRYESTITHNDNDIDERTTLRSESYTMEIVKSKVKLFPF